MKFFILILATVFSLSSFADKDVLNEGEPLTAAQIAQIESLMVHQFAAVMRLSHNFAGNMTRKSTDLTPEQEEQFKNILMHTLGSIYGLNHNFSGSGQESIMDYPSKD